MERLAKRKFLELGMRFLVMTMKMPFGLEVMYTVKWEDQMSTIWMSMN